MTSPRACPRVHGEFIDREKPLTFTFEGRAYGGFAGDTVASALAANGVALLSRSFKYHRPRGILSLASCEANTLVEVNGTPNVFAERHVLRDGDRVRAQNYAGSLALDRHAWIGAFGRFFPVGFYYRAFFKPRAPGGSGSRYIRRIAGLGRVDVNAPHGYYDKAYLFADVAVIGGGPAGLSAALTAAQAGARVCIIDDQPVLGGSLNYLRYDAAGVRAARERDALVSRLPQPPQITVMTGASCEGLFADNWLAIVRDRRLYKLRADRVVLATGALEQPAVFRNNDLPGIMLGSAAQRLIRLMACVPATSPWSSPPTTLAMALRSISPMQGSRSRRCSTCAAPSRQRFALSRLRTQHQDRGRNNGIGGAGTRAHPCCPHCRACSGAPRPRPDMQRPWPRLDCDLLCVSTGFAPNLALAAHAAHASSMTSAPPCTGPKTSRKE